MKKVLLTTSALALTLGLSAQTYFSEDFTNGLGQFTATDQDGDGRTWESYDYNTGNGEGPVAVSESWYNNSGTGVALTPDNWLISNAIDLTSATGSINLEWKVLAQDQGFVNDYYSVYVSTGNQQSDFTASTTSWSGTVGASSGYMARALDVTAYSGQTIYIAFRHYNCNDQFRMNIDDVAIRTIHPDDVELTAITTTAIVQSGNSVNITGTIKNNGANAITAIDITYNDGTGGPVVANITGINVPTNGTYDFTHTTPYTVANATTYNLTVEASIPGATDGNTANNTLTHTISGLAFIPERAVVIEEGTGTWCGFCPRGAVAMEAMQNDAARDHFIGIAVHSGDPMTVAVYDSSSNFSGAPSMHINRHMLNAGVSTTSMQSAYDQEVIRVTNCSVGVNITNYDGTTGAWTANVDVNWAADVNTDHRVAIVVVEDKVTGTSSGYNQTNYYHGGGQGALSGAGVADWTTAGSSVPAANMYYDHVGRELVGGYKGAANSLTIPNTAGSSETYAASGTINAAWDDDHIHLVAMVIDNNTGEIMNAKKSDALAVGIDEANSAVNFFSIYPNPANSNATISFELKQTANVQVSVVNIAGQTVYTESLGRTSGAKMLHLNASDMANGMYFVNLVADGQMITKKLNIQK